MTSATVSVVVPSYNKRDFICDTVDSVLEPQGVPVEVIVVDDGSTDGTPQLLEAYQDRIRVHHLSGNGGAARARNLGASLARGDHLIFLDADDVLTPGTLGAMVEALDGRSDMLAACPWQRLRREGDQWVVYSPQKPIDPPGDPVSEWLGLWYIPPCAILWPRALFESNGGWDEELTAGDDEELMLRMLLRGTRIGHAARGEALYRFFEEGGTLSTNSSWKLAASRLRGQQKIEQEAIANGLLSRYRHDIGAKYYRLARSYLAPYPDLVLEALRAADRLMDRRRLSGSVHHRAAGRILGLERKERLARWAERRGWIRRHPQGLGA